MIIKRKYVRLKKLYMTDSLSKAAIDKAFGSSAKDTLQRNSRTTFFNVPFGVWLDIPDAGNLCEALNNLDAITPYDNGKTFRDVCHAEVLGWRDDGTVVLLLTDRKGNALCVSECRVDPAAEERIMSEPFDQNIEMYPD